MAADTGLPKQSEPVGTIIDSKERVGLGQLVFGG